MNYYNNPEWQLYGMLWSKNHLSLRRRRLSQKVRIGMNFDSNPYLLAYTKIYRSIAVQWLHLFYQHKEKETRGGNACDTWEFINGVF